MKNIIRIYILAVSFIFLSCGIEPVKVAAVKPEEILRLENFFKRSQNDSIKAGKVIENHKIIQHLTHLRRMDAGGKKYYLLEKKDITEMINSVTEGIYLDYILINSNGDIIYTNRNEELFGTNVHKGYEATPIQKCFLNRDETYFEDVSYLAPSSKIFSLYVSSPVYVDKIFHGVLILQIEIKKIDEMLDAGTEIFSRDGMIRVSRSEERVFSTYTGFEKIDMNTLDSKGSVILTRNENNIRYSRFNFKEINWILAEKVL